MYDDDNLVTAAILVAGFILGTILLVAGFILGTILGVLIFA